MPSSFKCDAASRKNQRTRSNPSLPRVSQLRLGRIFGRNATSASLSTYGGWARMRSYVRRPLRASEQIRPDQDNTATESIIAHVALRDLESVRRNGATAMNLVTAYIAASRGASHAQSIRLLRPYASRLIPGCERFHPTGDVRVSTCNGSPTPREGPAFSTCWGTNRAYAQKCPHPRGNCGRAPQAISAPAVGLCDHTREMARSLFWQCFVLQHSFVRLANAAMAFYNSDNRQRT